MNFFIPFNQLNKVNEHGKLNLSNVGGGPFMRRGSKPSNRRLIRLAPP